MRPRGLTSDGQGVVEVSKTGGLHVIPPRHSSSLARTAMVDAAPLTLWALLIDADAGTDFRKYRVCLTCPQLLHGLC